MVPRHGVVVVVARPAAPVALSLTDRSFGGDHADDFDLPSAQSQQGLDVPQRHDPTAGGYSSRIVVHDADKALTSLGAQMATTVGDLQKLPRVLSVQNPLTAGPATGSTSGPNEGPPATDGRTGRIGIQPARLDDGHHHRCRPRPGLPDHPGRLPRPPGRAQGGRPPGGRPGGSDGSCRTSTSRASTRAASAGRRG
ncbi:hypothetical protein ACFXAS_19780 [Streptomyces sp. NPDC059459]|uniref:hypothetical protein n=1 Tax=Streptomyces sp. NPDC059459 TaxID=3346839 RepID=UPI0036CF35A8